MSGINMCYILKEGVFMSNIIKIKFENYPFIENNSNEIQFVRYKILFSLIEIKEAPYLDKITRHKINVLISDRVLASERLWNYRGPEIPKIIYAHACEYIKSLLIDNEIHDKNELILDESRLTRHKLDVNKIPDNDKFECVVNISQRKKTYGFKP